MQKFKERKKQAIHGISQFKLTNHLLNNLSQFDITPVAKLVLLELSACYNPAKADMFPKQKTLAKKIGVSERSIVRAIQELFKAGLIMVECKYSNYYKFTSKIVAGGAENEKKFVSEKMSDDLRQNDIKHGDNLTQHEPTIEPIKEPHKLEDFKILKAYAAAHGAKNINNYVAALINNGAASKIVADERAKQTVSKRAKTAIIDTQKLLSEYDKIKQDTAAPESSAMLQVFLAKYRNPRRK